PGARARRAGPPSVPRVVPARARTGRTPLLDRPTRGRAVPRRHRLVLRGVARAPPALWRARRPRVRRTPLSERARSRPRRRRPRPLDTDARPGPVAGMGARLVLGVERAHHPRGLNGPATPGPEVGQVSPRRCAAR